MFNFEAIFKIDEFTMNLNYKSKILFFLSFSALMFAYISCEKNNSNIPNVKTRIEIAVYEPEFYKLQQAAGYIYIKGGAYDNGIIVYNAGNGEFRAFDRTCPHDPEVGRVSVDKDQSMIATDTVCGSKFLLQERAIIEGPSNNYLKEYNTYYDPVSGLLRIYN